jgi:glycosyltransferase involved in cell wall biosynthesis
MSLDALAAGVCVDLNHQRADRKIAVDVSSLVRWIGPPVGISRTEHAIAQAVLEIHDGTLCIWDQDCGYFKSLNPKFTQLLIGWRGKIDTFRLELALGPPRRGFRRVVPSFRHPLVMALERVRLSAKSRAVANVADRLQRIILRPLRNRFPLEDDQGRLTTVPYDLAVGQKLSLGSSDTVLLIGADWYDKDPQILRALKARWGFRLAVICYDLIPLLYPQFFKEADVQLLRNYWSQMMSIADLFIFTSRRAESDARQFANRLGVRLQASAVAPLGFDPPPRRSFNALPEGLVAGQYALFVSTVEPRKGHALLLRIWRKLLARKIPQKRNFRLVFVGRPGWLVDDLMRDIRTASEDGSVVWLRQVADEELDSLYWGAAFCLNPSLYEGFGLPILEGFARGKAVIASTGGALPEVVGDLSPCLDPADEEAWERMLAAWIEMPEGYASYEKRIATKFSHVNWPEAAARILKLAVGDGAATEAVAD